MSNKLFNTFNTYLDLPAGETVEPAGPLFMSQRSNAIIPYYCDGNGLFLFIFDCNRTVLLHDAFAGVKFNQ